MEHSNEQNLYTERYLHGELSTEEQNAFEEHFFNCQVCGEDVVAAARMMAVRHDVAEAEREAKKNLLTPDPARWRLWFPQAAAASIVSVFLGWFGAMQYLRPGTVQVQSPPPIELASSEIEVATSEERGPGDAPAENLDTSEGTAVVNLLISPHDEAESYVVSVRDSAGKTVFGPSPISRSRAENWQKLVVRRELPRGSYQIVIEGVRKGGIRFSILEVPFVVGER